MEFRSFSGVKIIVTNQIPKCPTYGVANYASLIGPVPYSETSDH